MVRHWCCTLLSTAVLTACVGSVAFGQSEIPAQHEIRLPIPESRGSFGGGFWAISVPSHDQFAVRLLPDQRLLVMNPNSSGQWVLTRIGDWWTESPEIDSLAIPGWTSANVKREQNLTTGMLVTADGRYAVVVSGAEKVKDADHIPFAPDRSIAGKPDTLVVLVDLKLWRLVRGFHTATLGDFDFRRAQIAGGHWIALEGYNVTPSPIKYAHVYERINQLISIPDMTVGPRCISIVAEPGNSSQAGLAHKNNAICGELLKATGLASLNRFESLMYLGEEPPPETYQPYAEVTRKFSTGTGEIDERNFNHEVMVGIERGFTPDSNGFYHFNPPFESPAGYWYEFQHPPGTRTYQLAKYDHAGTTISVKPTTLLAKAGCGRRNWCDCRIEDVREEANALLAFCSAFMVDIFDAHHMQAQWLTTFRTSNLSESGEIRMSKDHLTKQVLATIDGTLYVLIVERGETVRVYPVRTTGASS
jgi:hypothetical protein